MAKHKEGRDEDILDPDIAIIDSHHHLFIRPNLRYLLDDYLEDVRAGHRIVASVYVETQAMARADCPPWLRPVGEVEFANGVAAMSASGAFGPCRVAAAIVGHADLRVGDQVAATLDRMLAAAPDRMRGIRQIALAHPDPEMLRFLGSRPPPDLLKEPGLGPGLRQLARRGLSFDATVFHRQLSELGAIVADHPDLTFVLNHLGLATMINMNPQQREEVFRQWRKDMIALAQQPNVVCKLGGLGTAYWGFGFWSGRSPPDSGRPPSDCGKLLAEARAGSERPGQLASEPVKYSGASERVLQTGPIEAQSADVAWATTSICNDELPRLGRTSGRDGMLHRLSGGAGATP